MTSQEKIERILTEKFSPEYLAVEDLSTLHAGHTEAQKSGGGHYSVMVVAGCFSGKSLLERHRIVNEALKEELKTEIHALAIRALTPAEFQGNG